jgi:hypothetical protein
MTSLVTCFGEPLPLNEVQLYNACSYGRWGEADEILSKNPDINVNRSMTITGQGSLLHSAIGKSTSTVRWLLMRGAKVNGVYEDGMTPLLKALSCGASAYLIELLIVAGAKLRDEYLTDSRLRYGNASVAFLRLFARYGCSFRSCHSYARLIGPQYESEHLAIAKYFFACRVYQEAVALYLVFRWKQPLHVIDALVFFTYRGVKTFISDVEHFRVVIAAYGQRIKSRRELYMAVFPDDRPRYLDGADVETARVAAPAEANRVAAAAA